MNAPFTDSDAADAEGKETLQGHLARHQTNMLDPLMILLFQRDGGM